MKFITHSNTMKCNGSICPIKICFLNSTTYYRIYGGKFWGGGGGEEEEEVLYLNKFFREGMKLLLSGEQIELFVAIICTFFATANVLIKTA
jgi:hypothetical protein